MDHERLLVSKIIETGSTLEVDDAGVRAEFFLDPVARSVFKQIVKYKGLHGSVPTSRALGADFPTYKLFKCAEPFSDLTDRLRSAYHLSLWEASLMASVDAFDRGDLDGISQLMSETFKKVASDTPNLRDTDVTQTGEQRLERYEELRHRPNTLLGIPSGFVAIDRATQGFQAQQLVTVVGPPKAGKSSTMLLAAREAHTSGYSPLLIGFEMSNEEQEARLDAIAAQISHHRLLDGSLTAEDMKRLQRSVHEIANLKQFILSNDTMSTTTLSGIAAKVERYKPDVLIVDGVYMMQDENGEAPGSSQALTNITRGFKRMAQNYNIPIIITTQVLEWKMDKKRGVTTNSIGYSSSFAQDSDVVIAVERTDEDTVNKIKIIAARNAGNTEVLVKWDWDTGVFEELPEDYFDEEEYEGAKY